MKKDKQEPVIYEVSLSSKGFDSYAAEVFIDVFNKCGIPRGKLVEYNEYNFVSVSYYCNSSKKARSLHGRLKRLRLKKVSVLCRPLKKSDWQDKWKDDVKPFALTGYFDVVPTWSKESYKNSKKRCPIFLDTTLAFGTGLHETTRFMAQLVDKYKGRINSFMDIGTGTGILSIIASKCGASKVMAIDIDGESVEVAKGNFERNGSLGCNVVNVDLKKMNNKSRFDFVAANLITKDLIDMRRKICSMVVPGGWLAISGVSLNNIEVLREEFKKSPLRCLKVLKGEKWAAILYKRKS